MGININTKILLSLASIAAAAALVVGATFAFFSDVSSSENNIFQSGNFDLQVADNNESFGESVTASFVSPTNWAPGEKFVDFICFKNSGNTDIQQVLFNLTSPN